jgi:hypothetical protein
VSFRLGVADAPLIEGCIAWFECRHHAVHRTGDHVLFIGRVETCERRNGTGLVFTPQNGVASVAKIDGVPTARGTFKCTVVAQDAGNFVIAKARAPVRVVTASTSLINDESHISSAASASADTARISDGDRRAWLFGRT